MTRERNSVSTLDKLCAITLLQIVEAVLTNTRHRVFATLARNPDTEIFFFSVRYCADLCTLLRVTGLLKTKACNVKKIWKFYASKSAITRFHKKVALSRCAMRTVFVRTKLTVRVWYLGLCLCWYWMFAIYRVVKERDLQYCRSLSFLCGLQ